MNTIDAAQNHLDQLLKAKLYLEGLLEAFDEVSFDDQIPIRNVLFMWLLYIIPSLIILWVILALGAKGYVKSKRKKKENTAVAYRKEFQHHRTQATIGSVRSKPMFDKVTKFTTISVVLIDVVICCFFLGVANVTIPHATSDSGHYKLNTFGAPSEDVVDSRTIYAFRIKDTDSYISQEESTHHRLQSCHNESYSLRQFGTKNHFYQNNSYLSMNNLSSTYERFGAILTTPFTNAGVVPIGLLVSVVNDVNYSHSIGVKSPTVHTLCYLCYEKQKAFGVSTDNTALLAVFLLFGVLIQPYINIAYIAAFSWVCLLSMIVVYGQSYLLSQWDMYHILQPYNEYSPLLMKCVVSYKYLEESQPVHLFFMVYFGCKGSFLLSMLILQKYFKFTTVS